MRRAMQYPLAPIHIQILLHHYVTPLPWGQPNAPVYREAVEALVADGMLEKEQNPDWSPWRTTKKGAAWIKHLCTIPWPVAEWVIPT